MKDDTGAKTQPEVAKKRREKKMTALRANFVISHLYQKLDQKSDQKLDQKLVEKKEMRASRA